jgi:hypothetical protein
LRILKVKVTKDNKIMMVWEEPTKNGSWDEYQMTCSDEARPEFYVKSMTCRGVAIRYPRISGSLPWMGFNSPQLARRIDRRNWAHI